ncbi:hypothetical protein TWF718_008671 [Orbilia javanica]|uniref:Mitochondrial ribosomal protein subunit L20-domain-containing protein n=1 Tax=Orbilia javanica TaxID=47235 RepID=A0AAN8RLY2_9PEZI
MATPSIFTMTTLTTTLPKLNLITPCARQQLRYKSTTRRMTKALRLHPHGSFIGTASTMPSRSATSRDLTPVVSSVVPNIIHNPPAAAPTPFITPKLFVPKQDPRYEAPSGTAILTSAPAVTAVDVNPRPEVTSASSSGEGVSAGGVAGEPSKLPPSLRRPYQKTYHLDEAQVKEIQRLRGENPDVYTRRKLAKMYGCSEFFVGMVAPTTEERKKEMRKKVEDVKAGWGRIRSFAREERGRRRELWSRDL